MLYEEREKARRDIASMIGGAREEGFAEGRADGCTDIARKLLKRNRLIEEIMEDTGLTREEIESLLE